MLLTAESLDRIENMAEFHLAAMDVRDSDFNVRSQSQD